MADEEIRYSYMLLDRCRCDCEYFLNWGNGSTKRLWGITIKSHIAKMKELWDIVPVKPDWLSYEQIEQYERNMLSYQKY